MKQIFVKGLGFVTDNEANKEMLIQQGFITDDSTKQSDIVPVRANVKRVSKSKRTK